MLSGVFGTGGKAVGRHEGKRRFDDDDTCERDLLTLAFKFILPRLKLDSEAPNL